MIVDERIITFINSMDTENSEILETIEQEALAADVPIIRREMQSFLEVLKGAPYGKKTYARSGSRNCRRFLCVIDE